MLVAGGSSQAGRSIGLEDRDAILLDALLVLEAQSGDRAALRSLFDRWDRRLRAHACHLLGDRDAGADAAQDAWVAIVRRIGSLRDPERFGPWAIRIVTNKCRDARRRGRLPQSDRLEGLAGDRGLVGDSEGGVDAVREALRSLPPDQRALLSLRYAARLPLDAIAQAMGLPIGTVKSRLHTAREGVRAFVERATGTESDDADATCEPHSERSNDE
jgi:RNA polymerase sigma factor (sigma-70 family)